MNDWKTPEFWVTAIVNIAAAIIALLVSRGVLTPDEGPLWVDVVEVLAVPIALLVMAFVTRTFLAGQAQVRVARLQAGLRE